MALTIYNWSHLKVGDDIKLHWRKRGFASQFSARTTLTRSAAHYTRSHKSFKVTTQVFACSECHDTCIRSIRMK